MFDGQFRGRELRFDLPRPVLINDETAVRAIVRQGVNRDVLAQLREQPTIQEPVFDDGVSWSREIGETVVKSDKRTATMIIGEVFRSELILE